MAVINFNFLVIVISASILVTACNQEIPIGNTLSAAEIAYLRDQARLKCLAESDRLYTGFENQINDNIDGYPQGKTWKFEYKKDGQVLKTSNWFLWRKNRPDYYFRFSTTDDSGNPVTKYYKFEASSNEDMLEKVQELKCDKTIQPSESDTNISFTMKKGRTAETSTTKYELDTTYNFDRTLPAFFGSLNKKITKRIYNNDGTLTSTENYEYVYSTNGTAVQTRPYSSDGLYPNRKYCMAKFTPGSPNSYDFPFDEREICASGNDITGPDANGDATPDFNPAADLI